jgi:hypothetical protein
VCDFDDDEYRTGLAFTTQHVAAFVTDSLDDRSIFFKNEVNFVLTPQQIRTNILLKNQTIRHSFQSPKIEFFKTKRLGIWGYHWKMGTFRNPVHRLLIENNHNFLITSNCQPHHTKVRGPIQEFWLLNKPYAGMVFPESQFISYDVHTRRMVSLLNVYTSVLAVRDVNDVEPWLHFYPDVHTNLELSEINIKHFQELNEIFQGEKNSTTAVQTFLESNKKQ